MDVSVEAFVKETLTQILKGVEQAQDDDTIKGTVCPKSLPYGGDKTTGKFGLTTDRRRIFLVHFDIAVTTVEATEKGVSGGFNIKVLDAGGKSVSGSSDSSQSRVTVDVPIAFPSAKKKPTG